MLITWLCFKITRCKSVFYHTKRWTPNALACYVGIKSPNLKDPLRVCHHGQIILSVSILLVQTTQYKDTKDTLAEIIPTELSYLVSLLPNTKPSSRPSNSWLTSVARFLTPQRLVFVPLSVPTLLASLLGALITPSVCSVAIVPYASPSCGAGDNRGEV
jgi:hypothetical protein